MSEESAKNYDLVIVGTGAAGLSAAVYAGRYTLKTLVIGEEFGGETATAGPIENWPGNKVIDGYDLMVNMRDHAKHAGAEVMDGKVKSIEREGDCFNVTTDSGETYHTGSVILAIGSRRRHLNLPKEKELTGKGVHYCVTCDGPMFKGKTVAMVGGGDSSVKGINFLGSYAEKIYLITRQTEPHAEPVNMERMKKLGDKVELIPENEVTELHGDTMIEKVTLANEHNGSKELNIDGLFIEIGFDPDKTFPDQLGIELDERDYIKSDNMMRTNVPGLFVAGDATNHFEGFKQDITAAAMGTVAATSAYEHSQSTETCDQHKKPVA